MLWLALLYAAAQGIVQGITEWLPVSSTGHILLLDAVWPMQDILGAEFFDVFKVIIQLGSIMAVVVLYFRKLNPFSRKKTYEERKGTWLLWYKVAAASIPAAIAGLLLDDLIDDVLSIPLVIAITLILYGIGFIVMESAKNRKVKVERLEDLTFPQAFGIGAFQMLALIPGTSRSGSTILGATLLGTSRTVAAEFSFFMAIPVMLGASALKVVKYFLLDGYSFNLWQWLILATATVVSFGVSLLVIRGLMAFIKKHSFKPFGWYRIALGAVVLLGVALNWL